jgi:tRNA-2-methylthio-N6-dimethylallyladenosine synthase
MNVRDSEVITGMLLRQGYQLTSNQAQADILIYNTCSVRQHAEDKVWSELGRFKKLSVVSCQMSDKKLRAMSYELPTKPIIGLVGCMAQNYKDDIFRCAPQVDFVVGPSDIDKIPQIIKKINDAQHTTPDARLFERKIWETDGGIRPEEIYHTGFYEDKNHAYVVISEGCSNCCSYCIVPYVRGPLKNRDYKNIMPINIRALI